jgi:hypothetical protein
MTVAAPKRLAPFGKTSGAFAILCDLGGLCENSVFNEGRNVSRKDAKIAKARQEENLGTNLC